MDHYVFDLDWLVRWRNALEVFLLLAAEGPAGDDSIALGKQVFYLNMEWNEGQPVIRRARRASQRYCRR